MDFFATACALQPVGSLVSLTQYDKFLVILSASEVSIKLKCILNSVDISPTAQYDNADFCLEFSLCANALCSKWQQC